MSVRKRSTGRERQIVPAPHPRWRERGEAKRTYLSGEDRRAQILDVARRLFAQEGYHDANIEDICREAGIARGTLYQYFENKESVMLEVMNQVCQRVSDVLEQRPPIVPIK